LESDAELVRRIRAGDRAALAALYERYLPPVWRYDVVSETFLAAVRAVAALDPGAASVGGWLLGIARHKVSDERRRQGRTPGEIPEGLAPPADERTRPDFRAAGAETREAVARVMARLGDEERLVLDWKYLEGVSTRDIAARMGRTERAVEALLYRARAAFRNLCAAAEDGRP
jgi:RNA polymerase sigma-70 factor, ECF subfamily